MSRLRLVGFLSAVAALLAALGAAAQRVAQLERSELLHESAWASLNERANQAGATRISARLTEVALRAGEEATFEVCARGDLAASWLVGALDFVVWRAASQKLELKVALDPAHRALVKGNAQLSCLTLGGGRVSTTDRYAVDAVWATRTLSSAVVNVPLRARVLAKSALGRREGILVLSAAFAAVLCALSAFAPAEASGWRATAEAELVAPSGPVWALAFGLLGTLLFALALRLPLPGAIGGLGRGLSVALLELGLGLLGARLVFRRARPGLRLFAPYARPAGWLFAACASALFLRVLSHFAMRLVPSSGQAPIETFIAWPSGALSFAILGMVVPLAEELFFRGFVYGALSRHGRPAAIVGSILLFALAHAQQVWGNWGALLSVALTGVVLTLLRALSGSTLVPAIAHVLFNLSLWSASFQG